MSAVRVALAIACVVLVLALPVRAAAQGTTEHAYAGGSLFADVKWFSGQDGDKPFDGHAAGAGLVAGVPLGSRWDIEARFDVPGFTETTRQHEVTYKRSIIVLKSTVRNRILSGGVLVRVHEVNHGRVSIGYLGGISMLAFRREYSSTGPADTPASLVPRPYKTTDFGAAPTLGVDVRIAFWRRVALVPEVQVTAFRFTDMSGLFVRPRLGLHWKF
jgi:hypothetical protein